MKVLMIAPQPFFAPRGTPISIYQRLLGLSALGYDVDLVTYHIGDDIDLSGVNIHRAPPLPFVDNVKIGPSWTKIPLDILLFVRALWMMLTNRYDVIHTHEEAAFFGPIFSTLFRVPHIYDMHSSLPKQLKNFKFCDYRVVVKLFKLLERWVLRTSNVILTVGMDLEEYVAETYRHANHIRIENTAAQLDDEDDRVPPLMKSLAANGKLAVVYTGTLEQYQGLDLLLESAQIVQPTHPEVVWVIVGGQTEQVEFWQSKANRLGLTDAVIFVGTVPLEESLRYLKAADILVSSRTNGLSIPMKIYSYLQAGKPIVATDTFAHTQVLSNETAVLVEATPEAFASGVLRLVEDPALRMEVGRQAQLYADQHFSFDCFAAKLEKAYLSAKLAKSVAEISQLKTNRHTQSAIAASQRGA